LAALLAAAAAACLAAAPAPPVLLVCGTASTPNTAECQYAKSIARNLSRWFDDIGIPYRAVDDEALTPAAATNASVIVLAYNPNPSAAELAALRAAIARKVKLVVFYSASTPLAELMGMRLGPYLTAPLTNRWNAIVFNPGALPHAPAAVRQDTRSIRPAYPATGDAQVLASWTREGGSAPTATPALVRSPQGFWMSHVLLDDGDSNAKRRMLLAVLGACQPDLWQSAAIHCLSNVPSIAGAGSWENAIETMQAAARMAKTPLAGVRLTAAASLPERIRTSVAAGRYPEAVETASQLRALLMEAYAMLQPSRLDSIRGIWVRQGVGLYPGNWDKTCRLLREAGITDVFPNFLSAGSAHYTSDILARSETYELFGDQLQACLQAARTHGLRVHVWMICWNLQGASPDRVADLARAGRLQMSDAGKALPWLCPSNPDNLRLEKDIVRELLRKYRIDGLHMDYIRYPDSHACFCDGCRRRFEASRGKPATRWPEDVRQGPARQEFNQWRAAQITRLVQDLSVVMQVGAPDAKLSAAVFGRHASGLNSVAQDWKTWLEKGFVHFTCPMNYTEDLDRFNVYLTEQRGMGLSGDRIVPGIGITANESRLDAFQVIDQIQAVRSKGFGGFMLFEMNHTTERDILPLLRHGTLLP
jgi:uncharacterized lipoprotein YddW (UPF0748 family)